MDGGFAQPVGTAACEGEACQGPFSPPDDSTPASATYNGPGNVQEPKSTAKKKKKQNKKKHKKKKSKKKNGKGQKKGGSKDKKKSSRNRRNG